MPAFEKQIADLVAEAVAVRVRMAAAEADRDAVARQTATEELMVLNRKIMALMERAPRRLRRPLMRKLKHSTAIATLKELDRA